MKAAVHTRYGPPDVVRVVEVDKPAAKANEVLVKVHATTVNRTDCGYRAAKPFIVRFFTGLVRPRVTVLGNEFAGVVEAAGSGVTSRVIDYTVEDFTKAEQRYDAVGKRSFGRCRRLLKAGGVHGSTDLGPLSQNPLLALVTPLLGPLFGGKRVKFPLPRHDQEMLRYFKGLIESGRFKPLVERRYPLEEVVEAYRYVETGQKIGNVVISVQPPS